jgi:polar amino acid transport system substrate-binding protein
LQDVRTAPATTAFPSATHPSFKEQTMMLSCSVTQARRAILLGLAALAGLALSGPLAPALAKSLDEILKAKEIRIGVNPTLPPRALFNDKNEIDGFEPDLARALAEKLGVKLTLVPVGSPDRIPFVAADKVDLVMGAMSRTSERAKVIDFTAPIHSENYGIVTTEGKPYKTLADLNDESVTLVQVRGTTAIPYLQKFAPKAKLLLLDNYNDRDRALAQGRADATFDAIDSAPYRFKVFPNTKFKIIPVPEWGVTYSSFGVAKGNYSLRDWVNIALFELHSSGTVEQLWEKWFAAPMQTKVPYTPYF